MSQIASFYLIKNNQRQELSDGDCSGAVYMAIWDWCESELDLDVRFPAPQTEDTLDCALLEGELASQLLAALREQDLPELAAEIAPDWDLPTEAVQSGLNTLRSHLELVHLVSGKDEVEQAFDQKELTKAIDTFLDSLSPEKRSIFISRYWYTDSISEIAVRHGMNDGAVSMTLNRLRLKLHNYLLERGFEL